MADFLSDPRGGQEHDLLRDEVTTVVEDALRHLTARERQVLCYRFGLKGRPTLVLREIGDIMGISRERVRQIERSATDRVRRFLARRRIVSDLSRGSWGFAPSTRRIQSLRSAAS
jgi:RNA polymerase sigma factor (sigma-70 family)